MLRIFGRQSIYSNHNNLGRPGRSGQSRPASVDGAYLAYHRENLQSLSDELIRNGELYTREKSLYFDPLRPCLISKIPPITRRVNSAPGCASQRRPRPGAFFFGGPRFRGLVKIGALLPIPSSPETLAPRLGLGAFSFPGANFHFQGTCEFWACAPPPISMTHFSRPSWEF